MTLFMAVPTIYNRLISSWEKQPSEEQSLLSQACRKLRLMVSGSAALPVSVFQSWQQISGHALLERYGMTEIGMALSNPLHGERRPSHVGQPLPGVEVRLVDEDGLVVPAEAPADVSGEIQIKGDTVFKGYWNKPEITASAFTEDGWFRSGDIAVRDRGYYRIMGRNSVDIIKTGGYKVSALEIEEVLLRYPVISQCAVVGQPDDDWGERVAAAVVLKDESKTLDLEELRQWAAEFLAVYKIPSRIICLSDLPRNAMGKVVKPEVLKLFGCS